MHGDISILEGIKEKLKPRKQMSREIPDPKLPYRTKKYLLLQSGGYILGALISPAISALLGFIKNS